MMMTLLRRVMSWQKNDELIVNSNWAGE